MLYELERSVYALIVSERAKQIACGFDDAHDDAHGTGELARMGAFFLMPGEIPLLGTGYVLGPDTLLPENLRGAEKLNRSTDGAPDAIENRIRDIVKGLACGVAEVQRLQRLAGVNPEVLPELEGANHDA